MIKLVEKKSGIVCGDSKIDYSENRIRHVFSKLIHFSKCCFISYQLYNKSYIAYFMKRKYI